MFFPNFFPTFIANLFIYFSLVTLQQVTYFLVVKLIFADFLVYFKIFKLVFLLSLFLFLWLFHLRNMLQVQGQDLLFLEFPYFLQDQVVCYYFLFLLFLLIFSLLIISFSLKFYICQIIMPNQAIFSSYSQKHFFIFILLFNSFSLMMVLIINLN